MRKNCYSCRRPSAHCLCNLAEPFSCHCDILILQHPQEVKKYHGTAKIVEQIVTNSRTLTQLRFTDQTIHDAVGTQKPYLLYPGQSALPCTEATLDADSILILLDGTWSQARNFLTHSPFLQGIPRLSFSQSYTSQFHIRQQPHSYCLSTIESIAYFIKENSLHADPSVRSKGVDQAQSLLQAFSTMVEQQLDYVPWDASSLA
jgi:DTW domain-containing protein YfiP